jgi:signal peptidase I
MMSLCILLIFVIASLLGMAWLLASFARVAGSSRGKLRFGLLCVLLMLACDVVVAAAVGFLTARTQVPQLAVEVSLLLVQLVATLVIVQRVFRLSIGGTLIALCGYVLAIALQFAMAFLLVRPFAVEAFVIPTASMSPTIDPHDRIMVNKIISPQRWDVMVYRTTGTNSQVAAYCKRLVGLPGERIRFEDGALFVNDHCQDAPSVLAGQLHASLPGRPSSLTRYDDGQTITLGSDEYFFVGDNIRISLDSRMQGPTSRSALVGVADAIYWPPNKFRVLR